MLKLFRQIFLFGFVFALTTSALWAYHFFAPSTLAQEKIILIPKGAGVVETAGILKSHNVIDNKYVFMAATLITGQHKALKAGEYQFPAFVRPSQALAKIIKGDVYRRLVTIPEGRTVYEALKIINAAPKLVGEVINAPQEGEILPDTYLYQAGQTRQAVIDDMAAAQKKFVAAAWEKRAANLPLKDISEAIILASIVEKETSKPDEYKKVAAVFINRLRIGMRLQSDPTVIYGMNLGRHEEDGKGPIGRRLLRKDLESFTPYNTYMIDRLPPTPICNPGRAAIEATLNPDTHNYLYFVADGTGGHAFAETLDEHNKNVAAWRTIRDIKSD
jgi:UPF0755 protein